MKINETIREILVDITSDKGYNACLAEELAALVKMQIPADTFTDEEAFSAAFYETLTAMCDQKELGRSGRGNIVSGAQLGYLPGTFRANGRGFGFLTPDARYAGLYPEDLYISPEDCGGAIQNKRIDLYMDTTAECIQFGVRECTVYFLGGANWRDN